MSVKSGARGAVTDKEVLFIFFTRDANQRQPLADQNELYSDISISIVTQMLTLGVVMEVYANRIGGQVAFAGTVAIAICLYARAACTECSIRSPGPEPDGPNMCRHVWLATSLRRTTATTQQAAQAA